MLRKAPFLLMLLLAGWPCRVSAAPEAELWPRWERHNPASGQSVDHSPWKDFLDAYLVIDHPSGINLVRYGDVGEKDLAALQDYLEKLQGTMVSTLNRDEQAAFWINLYNALTVKVVLDHYTVESIRDIDISPGWFSSGPWGAKLVTVEGEDISLDDIEHRILRPIWKDPRIHYAVNCASIGCPNLQPEPFTARNLDRLLELGAHQYVNHPRGVDLRDSKMTLSSIYDWFQEDFGGSEKGVLLHLEKYAEPALGERLKNFKGSIFYRYDWTLNDPEAHSSGI